MKRALLFALVVLGLVLIVWWMIVGNETSKTTRYKITVEVETPEGVKVGSSVREYTARRQFGANGRSLGTELRGEAVAVDLPGGRTLFALLRGEFYELGEYNALMVKTARLGEGKLWGAEPVEVYPTFPPQDPATFDHARPYANMSQDKYLPMLVTFRDIDDPTSVKHVDASNLAPAFGAGYVLRRITVEVVGDKPESTIRARLRWLGEYPEPRLDPAYIGSTEPNLSQLLWHGDFVRSSKR